MNPYDRRTILLHWLTAALVALLWTLGQTIDWFPEGTPRVFARSTHIVLGVALAFVLVTRIAWRASSRSLQLPPAGLGRLDRVAAGTHWLLYVLLVSTVALGITNAWVRGDLLLNLVRIPAFDPTDKVLRDTVEDWHAWAADSLLIVALLHTCAALLHHLVWKDGVLQRMWPSARTP